MFNIQWKDLMMLRFSNTKSSILFNLLSVGEAPHVELDVLLHIEQQFNYVVRGDDGVQFYSSTTLLWETWWPWRPLPHPKSCQNMMRTWAVREKYCRTAGVRAHWFDATDDKKTCIFTKKQTFCQRARWIDAHIELVVIKQSVFFLLEWSTVRSSLDLGYGASLGWSKTLLKITFQEFFDVRF